MVPQGEDAATGAEWGARGTRQLPQTVPGLGQPSVMGQRNLLMQLRQRLVGHEVHDIGPQTGSIVGFPLQVC